MMCNAHFYSINYVIQGAPGLVGDVGSTGPRGEKVRGHIATESYFTSSFGLNFIS